MTVCRRHDWVPIEALTREQFMVLEADDQPISSGEQVCYRCIRRKDAALSKRGRNNRKRGNSHELSVARKYGGEKVGQLGLPEDIRGERWATQVKTRQGEPPANWTAVFAALDGSRGQRMPRLILRYLKGPGHKPLDFIVVRGDDWLDEYGKDDSEDAA